MAKRALLLLICLSLTLGLSALLIPPPSRAIGKATPTPERASADALDVDEALGELPSLIDAQDYEAAITLAGRILEADAESWQAHYYRGFAHARREDYSESLADLDLALALRPWDSGLLRLRGDVHLNNSNPRRAKSDYERSLFHSPRALQTYHSLVRLHERDVDKSIRDLYQALLDAGQAKARGGSNRALEILSDLIAGYDRRGAAPALGYAYFMRAAIWTDNEAWERALADLEAALSLQPEMQDYYMSRGFIHSENGDAAAAAPDFYRRMTLLERESIDETLAHSSSVTVAMDYGLVARLRFEGEAGQKATVAARDFLGAGVDPLLVLLDTTGLPVAGDDDGGGELDALISDYELPATGVYTVLISHANAGYEGAVRVNLRLPSVKSPPP